MLENIWGHSGGSIPPLRMPSLLPHDLCHEWNVSLQLPATILCCCLAAKSYLTLCDPMDCSPPGSSVHGILQARVLEWVFLSPGDLPDPGMEPVSILSPVLAGRLFFFFFLLPLVPLGKSSWFISISLCLLKGGVSRNLRHTSPAPLWLVASELAQRA